MTLLPIRWGKQIVRSRPGNMSYLATLTEEPPGPPVLRPRDPMYLSVFAQGLYHKYIATPLPL